MWRHLRRQVRDQDIPIEPKTVSPTGLHSRDLDPDALRAVERLQSRGFEAYLVGGCVRDLLLGRQPKDFDIATSARPQQVKRTFPRNCRIIGRRFKLAHLHFHNNQKILEVATFRRAPDTGDADSDDLLITRDNEFGTAEEDALRRDFTINSLFFDPISDRILDWADGLQDLEARTVRTIGDPMVRFPEDPVRILRAAKFAGRIGLHIADDAWQAMIATAPDLARSAPPRVLEEILRLLRGGHALPSFQILRDTNALGVILPQVGEFLAEADFDERRHFWRLLDALDRRIAEGHEPTSAVMLGTLFERVIARASAAAPRKAATTIAETILAPVAQDLRLPRRDAGSLKRICGVQQRFAADGGRRYKLSAFLNDPYLREALELFELGCVATGSGFDQLAIWRERAEAELGPFDSPEQLDAIVLHRVEHDDRSGRGPGRPRPNGRDSRRSDGKEHRKPDGRSAKDRRKSRDDRSQGRSKPDDKSADRSKKRGGKKQGSGSSTDKSGRNRKASDRDKSNRKRKRDEVATIEPESFDLSAFDSELDPTRRAPTFGALVEGQPNPKNKRKRGTQPRIPNSESDDYRPPPPPGSPDAAPPPPPPAPGDSDDKFGDW